MSTRRTSRFRVRIDSTLYSVRCNVEGIGYQILKHKIAPRRNGVDISSDNVAVTPSARQAGVYDIAPFTLQNIISSHISDLKILSVESPVEIEFPQQEHDQDRHNRGGDGPRGRAPCAAHSRSWAYPSTTPTPGRAG